MNSLPHIDTRLDAYLAGALTAAEAEALEAHAAECEACAALLDARTRLPITQLAREIVPDPAVRDAVMQAVRALPRQRASRWLLPAAIAAGVLVAITLARPPVKGAQSPVSVLTASLAEERTRGQLQQLDAAREEIRLALVDAPDDLDLLAARDRLAAQRNALANLVKEFSS